MREGAEAEAEEEEEAGNAAAAEETEEEAAAVEATVQAEEEAGVEPVPTAGVARSSPRLLLLKKRERSEQLAAAADAEATPPAAQKRRRQSVAGRAAARRIDFRPGAEAAPVARAPSQTSLSTTPARRQSRGGDGAGSGAGAAPTPRLLASSAAEAQMIRARLSSYEQLHAQKVAARPTKEELAALGKQVYRPDHAARHAMRDADLLVNQTVCWGHVPGVEVGTTFPDRTSLMVVGMHRLGVSGISFARHGGAKGDTFTESIVDSGFYESNAGGGDTFTYSGEGGNDFLGSRCQVGAQAMERGNLGLANCKAHGVPVRVIRKVRTGPSPPPPPHPLCSSYLILSPRPRPRPLPRPAPGSATTASLTWSGGTRRPSTRRGLRAMPTRWSTASCCAAARGSRPSPPTPPPRTRGLAQRGDAAGARPPGRRRTRSAPTRSSRRRSRSGL